MKVTVLYIGSSLIGPLRNAESVLNARHGLDLKLVAHNFGGTFSQDEWSTIQADLHEAGIIFVIHVMDGENAARLVPLLDHLRADRAVIVINCMPDLMKRARMGKLDFAKFAAEKKPKTNEEWQEGDGAPHLLSTITSWIGRQAKAKTRNGSRAHGRAEYLKWVDRLPGLLRFVPNAGPLRDAKNYLLLMGYFLQPTPQNIASMILLAVQNYAPAGRLDSIEVPPPEALPTVAIYHPDAPALFETFEAYADWYCGAARKSKLQRPCDDCLAPHSTIGLLLMRPQIVSNSRKHYDTLIRAIEDEGLSVIPAISTLMDNRDVCERFFVSSTELLTGTSASIRPAPHPRVSQIVSLTGFSFVGGPAMNDSEAASEFLNQLNIPYRSLVSLDAQTIESWAESFTGLNPVQTGMQVAIPEIDGATESFIFGGIPARGLEPVALEDRCVRIAKRLKRWHRLQNANRADLKIALVVYCFPPNKGNLGTAADLDVFASIVDILARLRREGYATEAPDTADDLRRELLKGNSGSATTVNVAYRMAVDEYRALCPFVAEVEAEWGAAPGNINTEGQQLLIQGVMLGNVLLAIQPSFGYEDDPMRLLMSKGGTPHHGFAAFYTYLEKVFKADAVVHVGTHGAMEFMPGKQVGLSGECWPDRLIGELPNLYLYSINNPSEGTIAKRRSYAELVSYLTPPIENAGLYRGLASLKDLIASYRAAVTEPDRDRLYRAIEDARKDLNFELPGF